jgi:NTP pyrophosphatase (non-canonical NTP hydrolase)
MWTSLDLASFRAANIERCEGDFHELSVWSPTDWACAAAGELGEACNMIKKLRRGQDIDLQAIGFELADAVTYIDLLAVRLQRDLALDMITKFNIISDRSGSKIYLPVP